MSVETIRAVIAIAMIKGGQSTNLDRSSWIARRLKHALEAHAHKDRINYEPAPNASLAPVTTTTTITAHVSPDAGLETLKTFLDGTQQSLVVGMYDFTSGRISQTFIKDLSGTRTLQMVLDNPPTRPNPTHDQTDTQTVKELEDQLQGRAHIARALAGDDVFVSKFMFPSSYHIKVIVRDGNAFWLSSGNLNNTNQPDLASPPATEDRDWHVIVQDAELAQTFSAFLNQDFLSASEYQIAITDNAAAGEIKGGQSTNLDRSSWIARRLKHAQCGQCYQQTPISKKLTRQTDSRIKNWIKTVKNC